MNEVTSDTVKKEVTDHIIHVILSAYNSFAKDSSVPPSIDEFYRFFSRYWVKEMVEFLDVNYNAWGMENSDVLGEGNVYEKLKEMGLESPAFEDVHYVLNYKQYNYLTHRGDWINEVISKVW